MADKELVEFRKAWITDINKKLTQSTVTNLGKYKKEAEKPASLNNIEYNKCDDRQNEKRPRTTINLMKLSEPVKDDCKLILKRCRTDLNNRDSIDTPANIKYKKYTENLLNSQNEHHSKTTSTLQNSEQENLLEILISDIDETVSLPFFDLELPKEIALKIFRFLSLQDLNNCSLVNKKWKFLAEDDLLWYEICLKYGFDTDATCVLDREGWKNIVKNLVLKEKKFKKNWKERICQISELEYAKGGILYAASVFKNKVITGYANGSIKVWDILTENPIASLGSLQTESEFSQENSISCVCVSEDLCTAGYNNGDVLVWQNGLDFPLINRYSNETTINCLNLGRHSCSVISSSGCEMRIDVANENGIWNNLYNGHCDKHITSAHLYDISSYQAVLSTIDTVEIHDTKGRINVLEKALAAEVSHVWYADRTICIGITPLQCSILDGYRIKEYCLETGGLKHLMKGPYSKVTCLHGYESLLNILAVGCSDKFIRIHDNRTEDAAMQFSGIPAVPCSLQVDDWKLIAGDLNGFISVWDQRTKAILWQTRTRHAVRICHVAGPCLVTASIPVNKNPRATFWYADDLIQHRRYRGTIRIYNFNADCFGVDVPDICQSDYIPLSGYNYNINLSTPYDHI